jgi:hypothetical protein
LCDVTDALKVLDHRSRRGDGLTGDDLVLDDAEL